MIRSPRRRTMRTDSDSTSAAARVEVVGVERDQPALGLRHDLLGDDEAVAVERAACPARPRRRRSARRARRRAGSRRCPWTGMIVSGCTVDGQATAASVCAGERGGDPGVGHHRVGDDRVHARGLDLARRGRASTASITSVPQNSAYARATPTHDTSMPSGPISRSAGPFTGRAADDRADADDAVAAGDEHVADAGHREDRADRDHRVRRADEDGLGRSSASSTPGAAARGVGAVEVAPRRPAARRARARTTPASRARSRRRPSDGDPGARRGRRSSAAGAARRPRPRRSRPVTSLRASRPSRRRSVRKRWVARSRSPRRNQVSSP